MELWHYLLYFIAALLIFLSFTTKRGRYYFIFTSFSLVAVLTGIFCIPIFVFRPRNVANFQIPLKVVRLYKRLVNIHTTVIDGHYLKEHQSYVIACNHQSSIDILMLSAFWPEGCTILAKKEILLYTGPFGFASWLCGSVFINRGDQKQAHLTISKVTEEVLKKKLKILIFPEGTRSCSTELHTFKKGAFHLAIDAQIPIVPVVISSFLPFLDPKRQLFSSGGQVTIRCLPPVLTKGRDKSDVTALCNEVQSSMAKAFAETVPAKHQ